MARRSALPIAVLLGVIRCGGVASAPGGEVRMAELWVEPGNVASRELVYGRGKRDLLPKPDTVYRFEDEDTTGQSGGYDVIDPQGREWDVKTTGDEAQTEVVLSRILWALGYHQPVVYYVPEWRMEGGPKGSSPPPPGRFRLESDHKNLGEWSWQDCPFVGTRQYRGLLVINILLNNWDYRSSQNRVYKMKGRSRGAETWYVVQDLGGSLGRTHLPYGSRNDLPGFESQNLIDSVKDEHVKFDYHARHHDLLEDITVEDVTWACKLMARLTDKQLRDAFRGAGYSTEVSDRYARKIRQKIEEGLALEKGSMASR